MQRKKSTSVTASATGFNDLSDSAFVGVGTVSDLFGISVPSAWRWTREGLLPKTVRITPGCTRWRVGDLRKRLAELAEAA